MTEFVIKMRFVRWAAIFLLGIACGVLGLRWYQSLDPEAQRRAAVAQREREHVAVTVMIRALEVYNQTLTNRSEP